MNWNQVLFDVFPYVALTLAVAGTVLRWRVLPFTVSSLSSQLLERRKLYWGSVAFHWGITLLLLAHLAVLVWPRGVERWNQVPARLYALEITGLALGVWTLVGLGILIFRRLSEPKVKAVTSPMDLALLAVLALQVVTGLWIALGYRFGSQWAPAVFVPYVRSLLALQVVATHELPMPRLRAAALLGRDARSLLADLEGLGLVTPAGAGHAVSVVHSVIAQAALAALLPGRREKLHDAIARSLPNVDPGAAVRRAYHQARGADHDAGFRAATSAARRLRSEGEPGRAADFVRQALRLLDEDDPRVPTVRRSLA